MLNLTSLSSRDTAGGSLTRIKLPRCGQLWKIQAKFDPDQSVDPPLLHYQQHC
jgi:hypothetical protein